MVSLWIVIVESRLASLNELLKLGYSRFEDCDLISIHSVQKRVTPFDEEMVKMREKKVARIQNISFIFVEAKSLQIGDNLVRKSSQQTNSNRTIISFGKKIKIEWVRLTENSIRIYDDDGRVRTEDLSTAHKINKQTKQTQKN